MALDRVWTMFPNGATDTEVDVWLQAGVLNTGLAGVGNQLSSLGLLYTPLSTVVLRTRYRDDVFAGVTLLRDRDNRIWHVNEVAEVGRRKWLDISASTYDIPNDGPRVVPVGGFVPPAGWFLQWRQPGGANKYAPSGAYVDHLIVTQSQFISDSGLFVVASLIPSPGYAVDPEDSRRDGTDPLDSWMTQDLEQGFAGLVTGGGIAATAEGTSLEFIYLVAGGELLRNNSLNAGTLLPQNPAESWIALDGSITTELAIGTRIDITPGASGG